jgi:hypothetical protein
MCKGVVICPLAVMVEVHLIATCQIQSELAVQKGDSVVCDDLKRDVLVIEDRCWRKK